MLFRIFAKYRNVNIPMIKKSDFSSEIIEMATFAKVIGHPVRLYILQKLVKKNACCYSGNLRNEISISRSTLSQHLKELKYSGLIEGEIEGPYIKYCLNKENWAKVKMLFEKIFDTNENHIED